MTTNVASRVKLTVQMQYSLRCIYEQQQEGESEPRVVLLTSVPSYNMPGSTLVALIKRGLVTWPSEAEGIFIQLSPAAFEFAKSCAPVNHNWKYWGSSDRKSVWLEVCPSTPSTSAAPGSGEVTG